MVMDLTPSDPVTPVEVTNPDPLSVVVTNGSTHDHTDMDSKAQTTARVIAKQAQVDASILRTDDQRRISGMWERTQQVIALSVVEVTVMVAAFLVVVDAMKPHEGQPLDSRPAAVAFIFLVGASNLVIGFYFGRTNHQKVGGETTSTEADVGR